MQSKPHKEGSESEQFWKLLGGKSEYPSQKIARDTESDPHLFSCTFSKGDLKVTEIYNFNQDDLMTEDIFILDCHSSIFVWVGQQVDSNIRTQALVIGEGYNRLGCPIYLALKFNRQLAGFRMLYVERRSQCFICLTFGFMASG